MKKILMILVTATLLLGCAKEVVVEPEPVDKTGLLVGIWSLTEFNDVPNFDATQFTFSNGGDFQNHNKFGGSNNVLGDWEWVDETQTEILTYNLILNPGGIILTSEILKVQSLSETELVFIIDSDKYKSIKE